MCESSMRALHLCAFMFISLGFLCFGSLMSQETSAIAIIKLLHVSKPLGKSTVLVNSWCTVLGQLRTLVPWHQTTKQLMFKDT